MENKLRVATILLFFRALIDELEPKDKAKKSAVAICQRGKEFVRKHFVSQEDKDLLGVIANGAYEDACTLTEMKDISVSTLIMCMFDSRYKNYLIKDAKINQKHVQSLYNSARSNVSIKLRLSNNEIAEWCLQCINKRIYDNYTTRT